VTTTTPAPDAGPARPNLQQYGLQVSAYDRVAGMLIALLVLVGASVLTLLIMRLTSRIFAAQAAVPVVLEQIGDGGGALGDSMEMEAPSLEETDLEQPELTDTLSAVTDAIAAQAAVLENPALYAEMNQKGGGRGDGRMAGSGGGRPGRPRQWEFRFPEGNTVDTYARQLDFFGIELGVLMPGNKVEYAFNLSRGRPDRRTGPADQEKRYYLTWRRGGLQEADRELLDRAGIAPEGRLILKFVPPELEAQLLGLERAKAGDDVDRIAATYFGVLPEGAGFRFYVMDQRYMYGG
jgi:hypothetical protein